MYRYFLFIKENDQLCNGDNAAAPRLAHPAGLAHPAAFNGNCGTGQAGAGGGTWYGDRASPTGGYSTNAAVVSRTPGFSQQNVRNVQSKEYAVFTCSVDSGNITSGSRIAPGGLGNIVSETTICGTSS